jgi:hypothetical protein
MYRKLFYIFKKNYHEKFQTVSSYSCFNGIIHK